ncbi:tRNA (adenosine(37)-N6)-dimethylallyltransferase MiaA [Candidatus Daviesbacteria bacterium]|nr:tRNA (adenosine(37)-N6)-dimethylallyltransferase MiaA [Candidatus Daviesbacteria bacterium]
MKKILVILGPTATRKTDLALYLAKKLNGELVACDSRQVYKGLDIGTGKLPAPMSNLKCPVKDEARSPRSEAAGLWRQMSNVEKKNGYWKIDGIKIHMYDVVSLKIQFTVADYVKDANRVINDIEKRGKLPIIVGGTGLYAKALIEGLSSLETPVNKKLRQKLNFLSLKQLQKKLQKIASEKWQSLNHSDKNNPRRLVRAIELEINKGDTGNRGNWGNQRLAREFDILKIGLNASRDILYEKINKRVYKWIEEGILEEVKNLRSKGISKDRFKELGLEYSVALEYLDKKITLEEMVNKMQTKVRQYAKRQITWFKRDKNIFWFDISDKDYLIKVENFITKWYHQLKITKYAAKN